MYWPTGDSALPAARRQTADAMRRGFSNAGAPSGERFSFPTAKRPNDDTLVETLPACSRGDTHTKAKSSSSLAAATEKLKQIGAGIYHPTSKSEGLNHCIYWGKQIANLSGVAGAESSMPQDRNNLGRRGLRPRHPRLPQKAKRQPVGEGYGTCLPGNRRRFPEPQIDAGRRHVRGVLVFCNSKRRKHSCAGRAALLYSRLGAYVSEEGGWGNAPVA